MQAAMQVYLLFISYLNSHTLVLPMTLAALAITDTI